MTDGLKPVGVELVAEGAPAFTNAVGRASTSLGAFERAAKTASAGINVLGQVAIGALRRVGELGVDALVRAGREVLRFGQRTLEAAAMGTEMSTAIDRLGERLLGIVRFNLDPLFDQFKGVVERASPAIEGLVNYLSRAFAQLGQNALTWGENISGQLAQGIYDGAQMVLDALIYIGQLITNLLMPGSPPKLLPDLDDWGTEAANVYLAGWGKADFSLLSTLGSQIENLLRSQAPKNDTNLIPRILGTREAIAQAIAQARELGQVTAASLDAIYRAAGAVTPQIKDYLKSVFDLDLANTNLAAAQDALNKATEKYAALLKPVDAELARIGEAQAQLTEEQEIGRLKLIAADPNALASEKEQARLKIQQILAERKRRALLAEQAVAVDAAQTNVDNAQKQVDAAQAQYDADKGRIDFLTEQNRLIAEQGSLLDRLAAAVGAVAKAAGGKLGGGVVPIKPEFELPPEIQEKLDALLAKIQTLKETWGAAWVAMKAAMQPLVDFAKNQFERALDTVFENIEIGLGELEKFWKEHHDKIKFALELAFRVLTTVATGSMTLLSGAITAGLQIINGDWEGAWETAKRTLRSFMDQALAIVNQDWPKFQKTWSDNFEMLSTILNTSMNTMSEDLTEDLQGMSDNLNTWLNETSASMIETWTGIFNNLKTIAVTAIAEAVAAVLSLISLVNSPLGGAGGTGAASNVVSPPASGGYSTSTVNSSSVTNYNYNASYTGAPASPQADFAAMQLMAR